ncbi:MAG: glycoside hydrolase family 105 protein [Aristaeellaceae bacterium]
MSTENRRPISYAMEACDTLMRKFAPEDLPPKGRFHYHQGVFLSGMQKTYRLCKDEKYNAYLKAYVDSLIDQEGNVHGSNMAQMDDIQPGILLYDLYEQTHDERYRKALDTLVAAIIDNQRSPEGGFWHKDIYPDQMWLDGLYMGGPICAQYGRAFNRPLCYEVCAYQALLMEKRTRDEKTGLLYHAYDQSSKAAWADPVTGKSAEFWGRSIGWVPVAILDDLDFIPEEFAARGEMIRMTTDLIKAIVPYQDEETGLWYQVVNKGEDPRNWLETSCSCLYVAAICKAVRKGYLDKSYLRFARKGYEGVISRLKWDEKGIIIDGVCVGTGVGDYEHYLARPTSANDLHGMGAFILMCQEVEQVL